MKHLHTSFTIVFLSVFLITFSGCIESTSSYDGDVARYNKDIIGTWKHIEFQCESELIELSSTYEFESDKQGSYLGTNNFAWEISYKSFDEKYYLDLTIFSKRLEIIEITETEMILLDANPNNFNFCALTFERQ